MDKLANSWGWLVTMLFVTAIFGAGPIALAGGSYRMAVWAGLVATASYLKGKLEPRPEEDPFAITDP